jgi:hypothetical protein
MSSISNFVPSFSPKANGFKFSNSFSSSPLFTIPLPPPFGQIGIGDASNGVCGGMVFAVRDYWQIHQAPPPSIVSPMPDSVLYNFIVQRLFDSFGLPWPPTTPITFPPGASAITYWNLMQPSLPDHEVTIELQGHGRAWRMIKEEWPKIKSDIDKGNPSPIGLVLWKSMNPSDMKHHHQVLGYGYQLNGNDLKIHVYDPNSPGDDIMISLNISDPIHTTNVSYSRALAAGEKIWSFFRINDYFFRNPPQSQVTPPPVTHPPPQTIPPACQPTANSLKELQGDLNDAQQELSTAVGGQKSALAQQITHLRSQIAQKQKELDKCIQQNSGK